jgi:GT2 family glycosyltransferase/glycosyltransferase involved in cell wall biosynthesis
METRRCLESLLANAQVTPMEIIVVNDASPEPELTGYLDDLSEAGSITLLNNEANIGFVDSANLGMMMHIDRDLVLLNSDTEVHGDWLDRLIRCARENPGAGTVTPFSNNATICSYPRFLESNPLPDRWSTAELDDIFRQVNQGRSLELPTAVGYCTYITRACIEKVGYLDSLHFGRGYGEENDFCMRATAAGFKHLLAGDTFVYHQGETSFGDGARAANDAAQQTLRDRHPQYEPLIHAHFHQDPERVLRRRVDIARLAQSPRKKILMVTHRLGGGTEKFVQELARLLERDHEVLVLRPTGADGIAIDWARPEEEFIAYLAMPDGYDDLVRLLKQTGITRIHFHHFVELAEAVMALPVDLDVDYDFSAHDYFTICPLYNLVSKDGRYCREPDEESCAECLSQHDAFAGVDISEWRARWSDIINGADRVIVPSNDVATRLKRYYPEADYVCLPHPEAAEAPGYEGEHLPRHEVKVLVLGELSLAKGARMLEACALDARERNLPLCFRVLGWRRASVRQEPEIPLFFLGPYEDEQLAQLIERERADIIFFPAQWPETYSYTLSSSMRTGLPIAAPRLGAFPERLSDYPGATLLEWDTEPAAWNDVFISLAQGRRKHDHGS